MASPSLTDLPTSTRATQPQKKVKHEQLVGEVHLLAKYDEVYLLVSHSARSKLTTSSENNTVKQQAVCRHQDHAYPTPTKCWMWKPVEGAERGSDILSISRQS